MDRSCKVAVLVPCHNEAISIARVVKDFLEALPNATVYVYDNASNDGTGVEASKAGAVVRFEELVGKGNVVRRMFRDIDADFYVLVDGDDTYDASLSPEMIKIAIEGQYDLVNCVRREVHDDAYRPAHKFGNRVLTGIVKRIFGSRIQDILSGYKVMSKRFVKSFPILSKGFDIETEIAVHTLELYLPIAQIEGDYRARPAGSFSKLHTYKDGVRILRLITTLLVHERPLSFFSLISLVCIVLALLLAIPIVIHYLHYGLVPRIPSAILATGLTLSAMLSFMTGLIFNAMARGRKEAQLLSYLQFPFWSQEN